MTTEERNFLIEKNYRLRDVFISIVFLMSIIAFIVWGMLCIMIQ